MLYLLLVLVASVLSASSDASTKMTKNLKVLVSTNDFPESGLEVLKEQLSIFFLLFMSSIRRTYLF